MTRLDRYLVRTVLLYTLMVLAVLMTLATLFVFISQQDEVGKGSFTLSLAFTVTALSLPGQAVQLLPVAALLGSLLGLGQLARGSELIVMRAAGVSVWRLAVSVAMAGVLLAIVMVVLGEQIAPPMDHYAVALKAYAKNPDGAMSGDDVAWLKEGNRIVSAASQSSESLFAGVDIYSLQTDATGHQVLQSFSHADRATLTEPKHWRLDNLQTTVTLDPTVTVQRVAHLDVVSEMNPQFFGLAVQEAGALPIQGLVRYIDHLRRNSLDTHQYEVALWTRLARIVSLVWVCVLAVPFVLGSLRSTHAGARLMLGVAIGVAFLLISRMLSNSGELYGFNPIVVGVGPTVLLAMAALGGLLRAR